MVWWPLKTPIAALVTRIICLFDIKIVWIIGIAFSHFPGGTFSFLVYHFFHPDILPVYWWFILAFSISYFFTPIFPNSWVSFSFCCFKKKTQFLPFLKLLKLPKSYLIQFSFLCAAFLLLFLENIFKFSEVSSKNINLLKTEN